MNSIDLVEQFHEAFDAPVYDRPTLPTYKDAYKPYERMFKILGEILKEDTNDSRSLLRIKLIFEELKELFEAVDKGDFVEILDALTDIQYVLDGTYLEFGLGSYKDAAFREVHRSNMSKLGEDGKPVRRADGKILKGPNFTKPDLNGVLLGTIK